MRKTPDPANAGVAPPPDDEPAEIADAGTNKGEQQLDPKHEWPTAGGCYVRQTDGTLKIED